MSDITPDGHKSLESILEAGVDEGVFRGAAAAVGSAAGVDRIATVGYATHDSSTPVTEQTMFDLASLTKPIVTTTIALRQLERGTLDLTATLGEYVPRAAGTDRGTIPIRALLTHTSGLPPYKSFPFGWDSKESLLESLYDSPLGLLAEPGEWFVYSDLNFVHLADVLRHIADASLAELAEHHIFDPADLENATLGPLDTTTNVAMTKDRRWRNRRLQGEIHDYIGAVMEGESGNAGLFGSVEDVARIGQLLLADGRIDGTQVLAPSTVELLQRDQIPALERPHGLGWRRAYEDAPSPTWSPASFGHTGFTGTSLWVDPDRDLYAVLLTNRLLTDPSGDAIASFRTSFHETVVADETSRRN